MAAGTAAGCCIRRGPRGLGEAKGMLAHGGTAGLVLELSVVLVPLVLILILVLWGRRHPDAGRKWPPAHDPAHERERDGP
jgi:hypothetical protein